MKLKSCTLKNVRYKLLRPHSRRCPSVKAGPDPYNCPWWYQYGFQGDDNVFWLVFRCDECGAIMHVSSSSIALALPAELEVKR